MTTQHTPGPWRHRINGRDAFIIYELDHGRIAYLQDPVHGRDETLEANARLIAAAPELLAALDDLLAYAESTHQAQAAKAAHKPNQWQTGFVNVMTAARAAIARAEGRT